MISDPFFAFFLRDFGCACANTVSSDLAVPGFVFSLDVADAAVFSAALVPGGTLAVGCVAAVGAVAGALPEVTVETCVGAGWPAWPPAGA